MALPAKGALFICIALLSLFSSKAYSQTGTNSGDTAVRQSDLGDVLRKLLKKKADSSKLAKLPPPAILPSIGYNPSMGFIIGAKVSAVIMKGKPDSTNASIVGLEAIYGSKGILTLQVRHNIFTEFNKWNFQGNWQLSKYGMVDYGLGTGDFTYKSRGFIINDFSLKNGDSAFPIKYNYLRALEKVFYQIEPNFYIGAGLSLDVFRKIEDEKKTDSTSTPHYRYNTMHEFNPERYSANGLIISIQYNTREHPIRSYGGIYADLSFRINQTWLGSTKNAVQLQYDFRKYWSLSKRHPAHVLALWHWATYQLSGEVPYLALPFTAGDTYNRGGRGYTLGRFKGPSYAYFETEYRFPITSNDFLSGVCFFNLQTASNDLKKEVFKYWEPAGGFGLRILLQKVSRVTVCVDFAKGNYGTSGIFFGLNEAF